MVASTSRPHLVVLSGAGVSAESGLKTFRANDGLWEQVNIHEVATPEAWQRDPRRVLSFYNERRRNVREAAPNEAHAALAHAEKSLKVTLITQNIDDLHERAGSSNVLHLHGEIRKARSTSDPSLIYDLGNKDIEWGDQCEKGSQLRPHIVWFGESVPMMEEAIPIVESADLFLVVGTSLSVYPAASLTDYTPATCQRFLVDPTIPDATPWGNFECLVAPATQGVPELLKRLTSVD